MKDFPALVVDWPHGPDDEDLGMLLAVVDDSRPTAAQAGPTHITLFFANDTDRDAAAEAVARELPDRPASTCAIPDGDWAARSQALITAIRVGRIVVAPPWAAVEPAQASGDLRIVIRPSMGFGTGHHASTRLCLRLLQDHLGAGDRLLDVGTGSGVLALAARVLGAAEVMAIDTDADALANTRENIALNNATRVETAELDVMTSGDALAVRFDVTTANLTGALLERSAAILLGTVRSNGLVIASGYQVHERESVEAAFAASGGAVVSASTEDDWVGAAFRRNPRPTVA